MYTATQRSFWNIKNTMCQLLWNNYIQPLRVISHNSYFSNKGIQHSIHMMSLSTFIFLASFQFKVFPIPFYLQPSCYSFKALSFLTEVIVFFSVKVLTLLLHLTQPMFHALLHNCLTFTLNLTFFEGWNQVSHYVPKVQRKGKKLIKVTHLFILFIHLCFHKL